MLTNKNIRMVCGIVIVAIVASQGFAATLHVDPCDPSMLSSIQDAIIMAKNSDTVIVHPGEYRETIDFVAKAITVQSTDPNDPDIVASTIIDGGGKTVVAFQSGEKERAILSGFTIRNGVYGIRCAPEYTRPQIRQCVITSNSSDGISGGAPSVTGCTIIQNGRDGIGCAASTIVGCTVAQNVDGGIDAYGGDMLIRDCMVVNNGAEGVRLYGSTNDTKVQMTGCAVSANKGDGVFCYYNLLLEVANCVISGNGGDGIDSTQYNSGVTATNCTIVRNRGYGVRGDYPLKNLIGNSIIAYNGSTGLRYVTSRYNDLYGNAGSDYADVSARVADIQEEPLFVDIGYWDKDGTWHDGDYHVMSILGRWDPIAATWVTDTVDSPCLDQGDPNTPVGSEPNPNGGRINLGAYGGTAEASMSPGVSPLCTEYPQMDFNHDCKVDQADLDIFLQHWLDCGLDDPNACWPQGPPIAPNAQL